MAKAPTFTMPTGYEGDQRKIASRRKLAQILQEQGLANSGPMQSWTQVLGKIGQSTAGAFMDKKADKREGELTNRMRSDYTTALEALKAKTAGADGRPDLAGIVELANNNPMIAEAASPYVKAFEKRLGDQQEGINFGGQWRLKGDIKPGEYTPNQPGDPVLRSGDGSTFVTNPVRTVAAKDAQGFVRADGAPFSMRDPMASQQPPPQLPATVGPAPAAPPAGGDGLDLSLLTPGERQIMSRELQRRATGGQGGGMAGYQPPNPNTPMGNPLTAQKPPSGLTVDGKPFWNINGVAYDNPEGR